MMVLGEARMRRKMQAALESELGGRTRKVEVQRLVRDDGKDGSEDEDDDEDEDKGEGGLGL